MYILRVFSVHDGRMIGLHYFDNKEECLAAYEARLALGLDVEMQEQ